MSTLLTEPVRSMQLSNSSFFLKHYPLIKALSSFTEYEFLDQIHLSSMYFLKTILCAFYSISSSSFLSASFRLLLWLIFQRPSSSLCTISLKIYFLCSQPIKTNQLAYPFKICPSDQGFYENLNSDQILIWITESLPLWPPHSSRSSFFLVFKTSIRPTRPPNLVRESVLVSSGSSLLPIAAAGELTVVLPTKSSVNHHWTNQQCCSSSLLQLSYIIISCPINYLIKHISIVIRLKKQHQLLRHPP
jgi:hypothetical protein